MFIGCHHSRSRVVTNADKGAVWPSYPLMQSIKSTETSNKRTVADTCIGIRKDLKRDWEYRLRPFLYFHSHFIRHQYFRIIFLLLVQICIHTNIHMYIPVSEMAIASVTRTTIKH